MGRDKTGIGHEEKEMDNKTTEEGEMGRWGWGRGADEWENFKIIIIIIIKMIKVAKKKYRLN